MIKSSFGFRPEYSGNDMASLRNVSSDPAADGDILVYNSNTDKWEPKDGQHQAITVNEIDTASNVIYTAAQMQGGVILRDPNGSDRMDTTDSAANLVAGFNNPVVESGFQLVIKNTADADESIQMVAGSGVTIIGSTFSSKGESKTYLVQFTNVTTGTEAVTIYSIGGAHNINESYVWKDAVRASSTSAVLLATDIDEGKTLDGYTLSSGDRILLKDQVDQKENGIWLVQASGAPVRPSDFQAGNNGASSAFFVQSGSTNGDKGFVCGTDPPSDVIDTNNLQFAQFSSGGETLAGDGLDKVGSTLSVDATVVRTTGIQSIAGSKTFTDASIFDNGLSVPSSANVSLGSSAQFALSRDANDATITNTNGDLLIDNDGTTNYVGVKIGTNTTATDFRVDSRTNGTVLKVPGNGDVTLKGQIGVQGPIFRKTSVVTDVNAGNTTFPASSLIGGYIKRDPTGSPTDVTDTAANIIAAIGESIQMGSSFDCTFDNISSTPGEIITISGGSGVVIDGSSTIEPSDVRTFKFVVDNPNVGSEQVTMYDLEAVKSAQTTPGGANTQIQYNNAGSFGGISTITTDGTNMNFASSSSIKMSDSATLSMGNVNDLSMTHNGTKSSIQNVTGDLEISNLNATSDIDIKLGSNTDATKLKVTNLAGTSIAEMKGDGSVLIPTGSLTLTQELKADNGIDMTAGELHLSNDNVPILFGAGASGDMKIFHNGTDNKIEGHTGDIVIDQQVASGNVNVKLGSTTDTSSFVVSNSSNSDKLEVNGAGEIVATGTMGVKGNFFQRTTVTTLTTGSNITYAASAILGGIIRRDPNGFSRTDVTATAAEIVALLGSGVEVGSSFEFTIENTTTTITFNVTLTGGTGVTISGNAVITSESTRSFRLVVTNVGSGSEACTIYNLEPNAISPGGANSTVQYNNAGVLGGITKLTTDGNSTLEFGNNCTISMDNGSNISIGNSDELTFNHSGTSGLIQNTTGDLLINNVNSSSDVVLQLGNTSVASKFQVHDSSSGTLFELAGDGTAAIMNGSLTLGALLKATQGISVDNVGITLNGNGVPLTVGASTNLQVTANVANNLFQSNAGDLVFDNTAATKQTIFQLGSDTDTSSFQIKDNSGNEKFKLDGTGAATFSNGLEVDGDLILQSDLLLPKDNVEIKIGAGADLEMYHTGSQSFIKNKTGDLLIENTSVTSDIIVKTGSNIASTAFEVQNAGGSSLMRVFGNGAMQVTGLSTQTGGIQVNADSTNISLGSASEMNLYFSGTDSVLESSSTGDILIKNNNTVGNIAMQLGSNNIATSWQVRNASGNSLLRIRGDGSIRLGRVTRHAHVTTRSVASGVSYTSTDIEEGIIKRDCNGANRTDTTPTAAEIVAGLPDTTVGSSIEVIIYNISATNHTITLAAGTGVSLFGVLPIGQSQGCTFKVVVDNIGTGTEAVTLYSKGVFATA